MFQAATQIHSSLLSLSVGAILLPAAYHFTLGNESSASFETQKRNILHMSHGVSWTFFCLLTTANSATFQVSIVLLFSRPIFFCISSFPDAPYDFQFMSRICCSNYGRTPICTKIASTRRAIACRPSWKRSVCDERRRVKAPHPCIPITILCKPCNMKILSWTHLDGPSLLPLCHLPQKLHWQAIPHLLQ